MERVMRIELTQSAWKAEVLPLNYARKYKLVGKTGFEPATSWSQTRRSTKLSYFPSLVNKMVTRTRFELVYACVKGMWPPRGGSPSPEVTGSFCRVP